MADYTYKEIERMQNEAMKRADSIEKMARATVGLDKENKSNDVSKEGSIYSEPKHISMPPNYLNNLKEYGKTSSKIKEDKEALPKKSGGLPFLEKVTASLKDIKIDSDKALLLSLIMLFSGEKGDEILMTALIYMLT